MKTGRNAPCACGSGKKYKKCCAAAQAPVPSTERASRRFRFEPGSYGGPGRQYLPSAICYERLADGEWREYFGLVNPTCLLDEEDAAAARAEADLNAASALSAAGGTAAQFAASLRDKGYVTLDGFRQATD